MTGESCLCALYPPEGAQVWNSDIWWQPVPVHTVPKTQDIVSHMALCGLVGWRDPRPHILRMLRKEAKSGCRIYLIVTVFKMGGGGGAGGR